MDGYLNILKPPGMTSHDVVDLIRKLLPGNKAGHGGTLDPGAAGVLPLLLGRTTKFASYLLEFPKQYRAELCLGVTTDTADSSGKILKRSFPPSLAEDELKGYFAAFAGEYEQVPPMYSAIKRSGRKLYEYARAGQEIERPARTVSIYEIKVIEYSPPRTVLFDVTCSSGTYIRTLCEEIGNMIGCGAHMTFLLRTASGPFKLDDSQTLEELIYHVKNSPEKDYLLPADFPFRLNTLNLDEIQVGQLRNGRSIDLAQVLSTTDNEVLLRPVDGSLLGVYTTYGEFSVLARWKTVNDIGFILEPEKLW